MHKMMHSVSLIKSFFLYKRKAHITDPLRNLPSVFITGCGVEKGGFRLMSVITHLCAKAAYTLQISKLFNLLTKNVSYLLDFNKGIIFG